MLGYEYPIVWRLDVVLRYSQCLGDVLIILGKEIVFTGNQSQVNFSVFYPLLCNYFVETTDFSLRDVLPPYLVS